MGELTLREKGQCAPCSWSVLANTLILFLPSNERVIYPSFLLTPVFIHKLLMALRNYHPHLCSQSKGSNRHCVSGYFQRFWCGGGFSKESSFILRHVNTGPDFFISPRSSAQSMFCMSKVRWDAKQILLFYRDAKTGPDLHKDVKIGEG